MLMNQLRHQTGGFFRRGSAGNAFTKRRQELTFVELRPSDRRSALCRLSNVLVNATRNLVARSPPHVFLLKRLVPESTLRTAHSLERHVQGYLQRQLVSQRIHSGIVTLVGVILLVRPLTVLRMPQLVNCHEPSEP